MDELAKAFDAEGDAEPAKDAKDTEDTKSTNTKSKKAKKSKWPFVVLLAGVAVLAAGIVVLCLNLFNAGGLRDAEYLVQIGAWTREDEPSVIWQFTEIGKGKLTVNTHANDYDFIWAIDDGVLKIETDWLYALNDEYKYTVDQSAAKLTLIPADNDSATPITFLAGE